MKNNCGFGKRKTFFPIDYVIQANCKVHDLNYEVGGTREDRLKADIGFLWRNLSDINKLKKHKERELYFALVYFFLVRLFGWLTFK